MSIPYHNEKKKEEDIFSASQVLRKPVRSQFSYIELLYTRYNSLRNLGYNMSNFFQTFENSLIQYSILNVDDFLNIITLQEILRLRNLELTISLVFKI